MAGIAGILAIVLAKYAFGGLGNNVFNPALIGRVIAQTSWPVAITTWTPPFVVHRFTELIPTTLTSLGSKPESLQNWLTTTGIDGFTGATPLSLFKFQHIASDPYALVTGFTPGSTGETSAILIVLCGLYLWWKLRNYGYDGKIPICVLLGALITGGILYLVNSQAYPDPLFILTSGGLLFGAIFMATDPAGAPNTPLGKIIFGLFIGFIVIVIRVFCSYPEGVMFAILCGNAVSPIINELTQPRVYGEKRGGSK
jgi:electron transport complex protein RnfD